MTYDQRLLAGIKPWGMSRDKQRIYAIAIAAAFIAFCLIGIVRRYSPIPLGDDWLGYFAFNLDVQEGDHSAWWRFYAEHRLILPRLIYWIDFRFFGAKFIFAIVASLLILCSLCALLIAIARERIDRSQLLVAGCACVTLTFAWMQGSTLWRGFTGAQWFMAMLFPLISFYCLHRFSHAPICKKSELWFLAALASGAAATVTMANGLLVLPLLAVMSALIGCNWRRTLLIAALAACAFILYFQNYLTENTNPIIALFNRPVESGLHFLTFLGGPFFWIVFPWIAAMQHVASVISGAQAVGAAGAIDDYEIATRIGTIAATIGGMVFIAAWLIAVARWLRSAQRDTWEACLLFFGAFIVATALANAAGRSIYGSGHAVMEHYTTASLLGWEVTGLLYLSWQKRVYMPAVLAAIALLLLPSEIFALRSHSSNIEARATAFQAALNGTASPDQMKLLVPADDPSDVEGVIHRLPSAYLSSIPRPD